jgi:hypothetical protein
LPAPSWSSSPPAIGDRQPIGQAIGDELRQLVKLGCILPGRVFAN